VFYTKYRPKNFSEFLGPASLSTAILSAIATKNFAHAYFFYGPRGSGKTTMARLLAKALNCENIGEHRGRTPKKAPDLSLGFDPDKHDPCGECPTCKAIENGSFIDVIEIDAASNRGIDDIRTLRDRIILSPAQAKYKVYIIDEVHMLTAEAFNALLKTLEEPPKHAVFVLCTTESRKVPDTIRSRCQKFEFKRASIIDITKKLERIITAEKKEGTPIPDLTDGDLKKIAQASQGGFRDSETMLEQVVFGKVTVDDLVVTSDSDQFIDFLLNLSTGNAKAGVLYLEKIFEGGITAENWVDNFLEFLKALLMEKLGVGETEFAKEGLEKVSIEFISTVIKKFLEAKGQIRYASVGHLPLLVATVDFKKEETEEAGGYFGETPQKQDPNAFRGVSPKKETIGVVPDRIGKAPFTKEALYEAVRPRNHSVEALLRSCKIVGIDKDRLIVEAFYSFHKERLSVPSSRRIVEDAASEILGRPVLLAVVLGKKLPVEKDLSDKNIEPEQSESTKAKEAWEVFDGEVPV